MTYEQKNKAAMAVLVLGTLSIFGWVNCLEKAETKAPTPAVEEAIQAKPERAVEPDWVLAEYGNWRIQSGPYEDAPERQARVNGGPDGEHVLEVMCNIGRPAKLGGGYNGMDIPADPPKWSWVGVYFPGEYPEFKGRKYGKNQAISAIFKFDGKWSRYFPGLAHGYSVNIAQIRADSHGNKDALYKKIIRPIGLSKTLTIRYSTRGPENLDLIFDVTGAREAIRDLVKRCGLQ